MNKAVFITGANSGLGLAITRTLAVAGYEIMAGYRNKEKTQSLFDLVATGLPVTPVYVDVTKPRSVDSLMHMLDQQSVSIEVLINCAGYGLRGPVDEISDVEMEQQLDTNIIGPMRLIRAMSPAMRDRRSGCIINVSSIAGRVGVPFEGAYSASKHALEALSESLWFEMRPFNVNVVVIEPGAYGTQFAENLVHASAFTSESQHWDYWQSFQGAADQYVASNGVQHGGEVADLVKQILSRESPRFRYRVGADAEQLIPMHEALEFEEYAGRVLSMLGLAESDYAA